MTRLPELPGERIDRRRAISFSFDGKQIAAFEGDTIASALYASGRRTFSRSFKYHRPRGELCGCGQCANSLVQIGGRPGVRACAEPVLDGMQVKHTNARPGLDFDVMRATDVVGGPFTPPGFYYKTFIRPRRLWPLYEKALRSAAGLGVLPKKQAHREWRTEYRRRHCDVLVIGGGIAGLAAALRAAELGADVVLCDEDTEPGGALLHEGGHERARALAERARVAGVEILSSAPALGFFDGLVPVWQHDTLHQVRAARHIAATGTIEQPLVFPDNDLPGVMLCGGARRLAALYAVRPGNTAVVATTGDRGLEAALALQAAGVRVAVVADLRADAGGGAAAARVEAAGIELMRGATVVRALGRQAVTGAIVAPIDAQGYSREGHERRIPCDLIAVSGGATPSTSLLLQGGAKARYDEASGRFVADGLSETVLAAGSVAGHEDADSAELSGRVAGGAAAQALGFGAASDGAALEQDRSLLRDRPAPAPVATPPAIARDRNKSGKAFVDLDEDVTTKDIALAAAEGYDSIELSKRYTTVTMGPSQGRFSQLASIRALGAHTGLTVSEVGMTTARPPWVSVPMGVLAGRPIEPAKRSSIHGRQREQNAHVKWAGDWRRAYDYGDPEAEALAVHESAGVIDVSTLGKLLVRGRGAGALLDRLYPNRFSNLKPGRVRYGVMTSDAGRIMDDGTICRLDDDSFYVTTTSSGAGAIEEWFGWWLATWDLDAQVTDVTQALCAVNLAGPDARAILGRPDRPRRVRRRLRVPRRQARGGRGRRCAAAADRLRRRGRLRDPLPVRLRRAHLGRAGRGRGAPVRPRAPARAAAAEAARDRRPGHRLRVDALRRGDAVDRQARQGRGLHRPLGARARRRAPGRDRAGRLHDGQRAPADRGRRRAVGQRRADGPGHLLAPLAPARQRDRDGVGAGRAARPTARRSRSPTRERSTPPP